MCYFLQELGLIRKPASFMTSICDERGQELNYAGMPISDVSYLSFEIFYDISVHMQLKHYIACLVLNKSVNKIWKFYYN